MIQPILGGSSFLSRDSLAANFELNIAESAMVEVLWPGGVRNRLYDVEAGERIIFPEIPVNFQGDFSSLNYYETQVKQAIDELVISGTLIEAEGNRFLDSSIRAFKKENGIDGGNGGVGPDADVVGPGGDDTLTGDNFFSGQGADTFAFATFYHTTQQC